MNLYNRLHNDILSIVLSYAHGYNKLCVHLLYHKLNQYQSSLYIIKHFIKGSLRH